MEDEAPVEDMLYARSTTRPTKKDSRVPETVVVVAADQTESNDDLVFMLHPAFEHASKCCMHIVGVYGALFAKIAHSACPAGQRMSPDR